jgi:hypothetical protein
MEEILRMRDAVTITDPEGTMTTKTIARTIRKDLMLVPLTASALVLLKSILAINPKLKTVTTKTISPIRKIVTVTERLIAKGK